MTSVAYLCSRDPFLGGEYYRALRPAALASRRFGWHTAACRKMGTSSDDGPLSFVTPNDYVITPQVIIVRPIPEWTPYWTARARDAGQVVVADLDDDYWAHEDWEQEGRPNDDGFDDWFWDVDAVMCSTNYLAARIRELGHKSPVVVAPNCYDPYGFAGTPTPSTRLGTRLWLQGRMSGDLALYDELVLPLLERYDLSFTHIGAEDGHRFTDRGWPASHLHEEPSMAIPEMAKALSQISIGMICMSDQAYNKAKTETHAVELASVGIPLVAASDHYLYRNIPGRVERTPDAVRARVLELLDPVSWWQESERAVRWARETAVKAETKHLAALLQIVRKLGY